MDAETKSSSTNLDKTRNVERGGSARSEGNPELKKSAKDLAESKASLIVGSKADLGNASSSKSNSSKGSKVDLESTSKPGASQANQPQPDVANASAAAAVASIDAAQPIILTPTDSVPSTNSANALSHAIAVYNSPELLQGVMPLFLTGMTQELFKVKIGEDVTTDKMFKIIPKPDFLSDIQTRLAISDFQPAKSRILVRSSSITKYLANICSYQEF